MIANLDPDLWDDGDEERRTFTEWFTDVALLPCAILFLTSLLFLGSSFSIWAMFRLWIAILSMAR